MFQVVVVVVVICCCCRCLLLLLFCVFCCCCFFFFFFFVFFLMLRKSYWPVETHPTDQTLYAAFRRTWIGQLDAPSRQTVLMISRGPEEDGLVLPTDAPLAELMYLNCIYSRSR